MQTEKDIIRWIQEDKWMMDILFAVQTLNLPDWWVCAGFVRAKIWDTLSSFEERTPIEDVDVVYFDKQNIDEQREKEFELQLRSLIPHVPWSVKNEARMHDVNGIEPYTSTVDAISKFPETATALGVKLNDEKNVLLAAPCGINDVLNFDVKPTPFFLKNNQLSSIYKYRIENKNWNKIWPKITFYDEEGRLCFEIKSS